MKRYIRPVAASVVIAGASAAGLFAFLSSSHTVSAERAVGTEVGAVTANSEGTFTYPKHSNRIVVVEAGVFKAAPDIHFDARAAFTDAGSTVALSAADTCTLSHIVANYQPDWRNLDGSTLFQQIPISNLNPFITRCEKSVESPATALRSQFSTLAIRLTYKGATNDLANTKLAEMMKPNGYGPDRLRHAW